MFDHFYDDELETYCPDNDCERLTCHRCFPRKDCDDHEKCVTQGEMTEAEIQKKIDVQESVELRKNGFHNQN